jgi:hypothetical protein
MAYSHFCGNVLIIYQYNAIIHDLPIRNISRESMVRPEKEPSPLNLYSLDCILYSHYHAGHWIDFKPDPFLYISHSDDGEG